MKVSKLRRIATIYWCYALQIATGLNSNQLEVYLCRSHLFDRSSDENTKSFYQYQHGKRAPNNDLVDYIENAKEDTSGHAWIFEHPIWTVLQNPEANIHQVHNMMRSLGTPTYDKLFTKKKSKGESPRRCLRSSLQVLSLGRINNFDALSALLLLMRETEINWSPYLYTEIKWEVTQLICRLAITHPFSNIADKIYDVIFDEFIAKNNPLPEKYKVSETSGLIKLMEYPPMYDNPGKVNIKKAAFQNYKQMFLAVAAGIISPKEKHQLDYLWLTQQWTRRDIPMLNNT